MKLSRASVYALHSALQLAQNSQQSPVPCRQLAQDGAMPERFLLQVLRMMVNAEILTSTRGVVGGYRLARSAEKISLLDIVEATDGRIQPSELDMPAMPGDAGARVMQVLHRAVEGQRQQLASVTLAELLHDPQAMAS